jgi:cytochrome oxidase assembly protein ShyY1
VLVDRGWVRPEPGSHVPPIPAAPTQQVTITARLRDSEPTVAGKDPFTRDGYQQVYAVSTGQVAALTGVPLAGSYLQLVENQPGGLGVVGVPHLDAGPYLSYGIQWLLFGVLAPIALGYFVYSEVRARRRDKQGPPAAAEPASLPTVQDKLADRYGRRR